MNLLISWSK